MAYESLLLRHGTDYQQVRHDRISADTLRRFFLQGYERRVLPNEQVVDLDGLRGRLTSSSYTPPPGDPGRQPMLNDLTNIFDQYQVDNHVRLEYDTEIYFGRL